LVVRYYSRRCSHLFLVSKLNPIDEVFLLASSCSSDGCVFCFGYLTTEAGGQGRSRRQRCEAHGMQGWGPCAARSRRSRGKERSLPRTVPASIYLEWRGTHLLRGAMQPYPLSMERGPGFQLVRGKFPADRSLPTTVVTHRSPRAPAGVALRVQAVHLFARR
jgi:hypothetical protein